MTEETLEPVETETDPEEQIRELTAENRRLRKQIKRMREAAATSKKVEFSKIIFCGAAVCRKARQPRWRLPRGEALASFPRQDPHRRPRA